MSSFVFRRDVLTKPIFSWARGVLPVMSDTEREALEAGDVWWDADLFTGNPDWAKLLANAPATLTLEEAAFPDVLKEQLRAQVTDTAGALLRTPNGQRYYVARIDGGIRVAKVVSFHTGSDGKPVRFEIPEESDGTQRFIDLLPVLHELGADMSEKVVFVDELDRSFHSGLTRTIIESFFFEWEPSSRAQLLFTTHDATLIDQELFRRDELWLVDKNAGGETELKNLSDYQVRSDKRLMKDYLLGRFGAIPPGRMVRLRSLPKAEKEGAAK